MNFMITHIEERRVGLYIVITKTFILTLSEMVICAVYRDLYRQSKTLSNIRHGTNLKKF